ncbi:MAG: MoxR family ATPase, partial [Verrucomicrobia bacterium]|nr:MoxR family ATPase [Verrucomicrobiota bacterium]
MQQPPTTENLALIEAQLKQSSNWIQPLRTEIARYLIGQSSLVDRLLISLLVKGHILLEGVPGLAKTLALKTLASLVNAKFNRIQFTPDMLPADIVGTEIYDPKEAKFRVKHGPVFANFILADEINRAPAKVQSALLEAMQEKQVTIGEQTFLLPSPFFVLATQNPLEQEGTYPLPEAQLDRFMMKVIMDYPSEDEEMRVLDLAGTTEDMPLPTPMVHLDAIQEARQVVNRLYLDEKV